MLNYSPSLARIVESNSEIGSGTEEEVELQACSIHAVEKIRELILQKSGKQVIFYAFCIFKVLLLFSFID